MNVLEGTLTQVGPEPDPLLCLGLYHTCAMLFVAGRKTQRSGICVQPIASGAAAAASVGGQGWPVSLRRYVERAFAQKIPDEKKGALNVALKQIISDAQASNHVPLDACDAV